MGALRGMLHVAGNFLRRSALFFHSRGDGRAEISDSFSMVPAISLIAFTDCCVAAWMPLICWPISPVAFAVCSASAFTSDATTAKPRPASPARAASMVALSARRLVCPAMVLINSTTSPIGSRPSTTRRRGHWWYGPDRPPRGPSVPSSGPRRLISLTDDDISSVAEATDCTLADASSDAAATMVATSFARTAVVVSIPAGGLELA